MSFLVIALYTLPAAAQSPDSPLGWIPANFASFIRIDMRDPAQTVQNLNNAAFIAALRQPGMPLDRRSLNEFFPLDSLDTEGVTFENTLLPWLNGEVIIAYRAFDDTFTPVEPLLILPPVDSLWAAQHLGVVTAAQDFPAQEMYHGWTIYSGDRTALAVLPTVVLIGSAEVIKAALDTVYAAAPRLIDTPAAAAMRTSIDNTTAFAYLDGAYALPALSRALNDDTSAVPLLATFAEAAALPAIEAVGASFTIEPFTNRLDGVLLLYMPDTDLSALSDSRVLNAIPRRAMLTVSTSQIESLLTVALHTLPLSRFAGDVLGGFGIVSPGETPAYPTATDIQAAGTSFTTALETVLDIDLRADWLAHLDGDYALALLPNLNNPTPTLSAPFDALLIAPVIDGEAAQMTTTRALSALLRLDFAAAEVEGEPFQTAFDPRTGEPILGVGVVDELLIIGTGDASAESVRALRGDNRLVATPRWRTLGFADRSEEALLYADLNTLTLLRQSPTGGAVETGVGQLGMWARADESVFRLDITISFRV